MIDGDIDTDDPDLIQTPAMIDALLVEFGAVAARESESMTEAETAAYITGFLRVAIERLTGVIAEPYAIFRHDGELN